jgi:hypothetical protein
MTQFASLNVPSIGEWNVMYFDAVNLKFWHLATEDADASLQPKTLSILRCMKVYLIQARLPKVNPFLKV